MAKPKVKPQLSLMTADRYDDAAGIDADHWSRLFHAHVLRAFRDDEFRDLYEDGGRYPVSPSLLACIMILQYMFRVSDRQAVDATIMRRDWRMALGIEHDWEGFCPTVLVRFRQRLQRAGRLKEIFDKVLGQVRELGVLPGRRLRVDATHLLADVARLSRADMIQEAIRVVVCAADKAYAELRGNVAFRRLREAYSEEVWLGAGRSDEGRLVELGRDGRVLLELCGDRLVRGKEVLEQILQENFLFPDDGQDPRPLEPDERPDDHIVTPHEPDVRVGKKGDKLWLGDKVHLVETAEPGATNFIVDMLTTDPRLEDSTMTETILQRARFGMGPFDALLADGGYSSAHNSKQAAALGVELISPPRSSNSRAAIPASAFEIDRVRRVARCPEGKESVTWQVDGRQINIRFRRADCRACPRRAECTSSKQGRSLGISRDYDQLLRDRQRAQTAEFKELYRRRAAIEATISQLVHHHGLRRSRYRGAPGRALHAWMAAAALNVRRLLRCLAAGEAPKGEASCAFSALLVAAPRTLRRPVEAICRLVPGHQSRTSHLACSPL
jgi:transposase